MPLLTVATFMYPHEMLILKARLESEEIRCFVKDEYTSQINHFNSRAVGGVKLQIDSRDAEKALPILVEFGYYREEEVKAPVFFRKFDDATRNIPLLKAVTVEARLLLVIVLVIGMFSAGVYWFLR